MRIARFGYLKAGKRGKSSGVAWKPRVHPLNIRRHGWCGRTKSSRRSSPGIPTRSASRATKNSEIRDKQHRHIGRPAPEPGSGSFCTLAREAKVCGPGRLSGGEFPRAPKAVLSLAPAASPRRNELFRNGTGIAVEQWAAIIQTE